MSLPAWECGLKRYNPLEGERDQPSLPAWECGLKLLLQCGNLLVGGHSPRGSVD